VYDYIITSRIVVEGSNFCRLQEVRHTKSRRPCVRFQRRQEHEDDDNRRPNSRMNVAQDTDVIRICSAGILLTQMSGNKSNSETYTLATHRLH
jgi:hypothetical protein